MVNQNQSHLSTETSLLIQSVELLPKPVELPLTLITISQVPAVVYVHEILDVAVVRHQLADASPQSISVIFTVPLNGNSIISPSSTPLYVNCISTIISK
ncbi:hypothetical protein ACFLY2_00230 [Patescibacteria group bacterium]